MNAKWGTSSVPPAGLIKFIVDETAGGKPGPMGIGGRLYVLSASVDISCVLMWMRQSSWLFVTMAYLKLLIMALL